MFHGDYIGAFTQISKRTCNQQNKRLEPLNMTLQQYFLISYTHTHTHTHTHKIIEIVFILPFFGLSETYPNTLSLQSVTFCPFLLLIVNKP